jgi:cell division transport system permease protein
LSYRYSFREMGLSFLRQPITFLGSVVTLALSLLVFNTFLLVTLSLKNVAEEFKSKMEIEVYLRDDLKKEEISTFYNKLMGMPEIEEVTFKSKDEALKEMKKFFKPELLEGLETNPLPASFLIKLKKPYQGFADMEKVSSKIKGFGGVEDVEYGGEWVKKIDQAIFVFLLIDIFFGLLIAILVMMIVAGNVRNMISSRAEAISTIKLLGGNRAFISRPFFLQGLIEGGLAGIISLGLFYLVYRIFISNLFRVEFLPLDLALSIVLSAILLGGVGSLLALSRHI